MGVRLFIAIELPEEAKDLLAAASARLASASGGGAPRVRWVERETMHLTVKFLGDAAPERIAEIGAALDRAASEARAFEMRIGGLGAFPSPARPTRTVWAGLEAPPALASLVERVEEHVSPLGFPREERPFAAHVTIGRVKEERRGRERGRKPPPPAKGGAGLAAALLAEARLASRPFPVEAVTLFESVLSSKGPAYSARHRSRLGGAS